jgi:ATP-dependent DNA ligase
MSLTSRILPPGFIAPCLPTKAPQPPSGELWLHEIKHDGFRVIARKAGERVRLYSRPGNDLTKRFPLIIEALTYLRSQSCILDGEAVACGDDGIATFDRPSTASGIGATTTMFLYVFDLIELDGTDLRRDPLAVRKASVHSRPRYRIVHHSYALDRRRRATVTNLQQEQFFRLSPQHRRLANPANVIDRWCGLKPST